MLCYYTDNKKYRVSHGEYFKLLRFELNEMFEDRWMRRLRPGIDQQDAQTFHL